MTVEETMLKYLINNGMSDDQSKSVMTAVKKNLDTTFNNWSSQMSGYSLQIENLIKLTVNQEGLKWLNEHKPLAWFKPVFEKSLVYTNNRKYTLEKY
jgi:hypothetical protein